MRLGQFQIHKTNDNTFFLELRGLKILLLSNIKEFTLKVYNKENEHYIFEIIEEFHHAIMEFDFELNKSENTQLIVVLGASQLFVNSTPQGITFDIWGHPDDDEAIQTGYLLSGKDFEEG
jgi:hypothetical protein